MTSTSSTSFPAHLIVVADRDYIGNDVRWLALIEEVGAAALGRPVAIQVRAKGVTPDEASDLAARARAVVPLDVPLLLNGDAKLAARLGFSGVHWPEDIVPASPPVDTLAWHSAAVHSVDAAARAERGGADIVLFGAVYAPGSHEGTGAGLDAMRAVIESTRVPVFALGGILPRHVADCIAVGAVGVAAVSGVLGAPDVRAAVDAYLHELHEAMAHTPGRTTA